MQKILIAVSASLAAGFAVGAWLLKDNAASAPSPGIQMVAANQGVDARIRELEQRLAAEQDARRVLEERLDELAKSIEAGQSAPSQAVARDARVERLAQAMSDSGDGTDRLVARVQRLQEWRLQRLIDSGYSDNEARGLLAAESDAQLEAMQADWDARRNGENVDRFSSFTSVQDIMRDKLGDADYERYLRAHGSPAAVPVASVIDRSPGSVAGLQPGDQIISYDGERTFSVIDLRRLTLEGNPGENVIIEIDRDGARMQLSVPRGPIGLDDSGFGMPARGFGRIRTIN